MTPKRMKKIAMYLEYIAFFLRDEASKAGPLLMMGSQKKKRARKRKAKAKQRARRKAS